MSGRGPAVKKAGLGEQEPAGAHRHDARVPRRARLDPGNKAAERIEEFQNFGARRRNQDQVGRFDGRDCRLRMQCRDSIEPQRLLRQGHQLHVKGCPVLIGAQYLALQLARLPENVQRTDDRQGAERFEAKQGYIHCGLVGRSLHGQKLGERRGQVKMARLLFGRS